jgi:hypothetical protein
MKSNSFVAEFMLHFCFCTDALGCLPVYLMSCRKVLVLCGPTFVDRLWCIWCVCCSFPAFSGTHAVVSRELYTLFALSDNWQESMGRLEIVNTADDGTDLPAKLKAFDLQNAHCYSPNDEEKIRAAIAAGPGGIEAFNNMIHQLGEKLSLAAAAEEGAVVLAGRTRSYTFRSYTSAQIIKTLVEGSNTGSFREGPTNPVSIRSNEEQRRRNRGWRPSRVNGSAPTRTTGDWRRGSKFQTSNPLTAEIRKGGVTRSKFKNGSASNTTSFGIAGKNAANISMDDAINRQIGIRKTKSHAHQKQVDAMGKTTEGGHDPRSFTEHRFVRKQVADI